MRPSVLFISEQTLKERTVISDNIESKVLLQTIESVQEEKILPALGTGLYNRLIAGISGSNLKPEETTLLNDYIQQAMKWFVLSELPLVIGIKYYNRNILRKSADNDESVSMADMMQIINHYKEKGEFQLTRTIQYLEQNATEAKFTEYLNPGSGWDTLFPQRRGYSCPFPLNDRPIRRKNGYQRPEEYE